MAITDGVASGLLLFIFVLSNDEESLLKSLYETQNMKMYAIALKILKKPEDAEEAVQETFIRIADKIERIKNLPCPERVPFCVVVLKNISKNLLRDKKPHINLDDFDYLASDSDFDPQQAFFAQADSAYLKQIINDINPQERDIVLMKWGKKMKYREIGALLGISEDAAEKRGQRALKQLRHKYMEGLSNGH